MTAPACTSIDAARGCLAVVQGRGDLPGDTLRDLAVVRGALLFYRHQRFPGLPGCDQAPAGRDAELLARALSYVASAAVWPGNSLPQIKMLRGCLARLRRAHLAALPCGGLLAARDWRAAQLSTGDRI